MLYSVKLCLFLTLIIVTPLFYFTKPILNIWLIDYPDETVFFVKIILIQQIFNSIGYPLISGIEATGNIKWYQIITSTATILMIPVAYCALKFGHVSAGFTMIIYLIFTIVTEIVRIIVVLPSINLSISRYVHRIVVYSILPILIIIGGYKILPQYDTLTFFQLAYRSVIVVLAIIMVLYIFGINKTERAIVNQTAINFLQRLKKH